jgi:hypothetical protein
MRYEVSTPDGRRFEITAPDGIAPDVLSREVETALGGGGRQPASEGMPQPRRSWSEVPGAAMRNLPASAQQFYGGVIEAVTNPIQTAQNLADLAAGGLRAGARRVLPTGVFEAIDRLDNPETTQRISELASAVGGEYARNYGSAEGLRNKVAEDPVGFLADVSTLLGGGAIAAGRAGATGTAGVLRTAEAVTNPLTPIIAPIALAGRGAGTVVERGYRATDPEAAAYMDAAAGRAPQIIEALRSPQAEIVPGSRPLPSQIVAPTGSAEFTAFAQSAERVMPSEVAAREAAQSRARLSAIREVSGAPAQEARARLAAAPGVTPTGVMPARGGALEAAQEARAAQTGPMFTRAERDVLPTDTTIESLLSRPSMEQAVQRAARIAAEENRPFSMRPPEPPAPSAPSGLVDAQGRPVPAPPTPPAPPAAYSVQDLQYVKRGIDDLIADNASGLGKAERNAIINTRKELIRWIDSQSPAYRAARGAFQEASGPIDQMRVARVLENRLTQPVTGEATRGGMFASGVQEAPTTIRRATGEARFSRLSEVLTPDQMRVVDGIRRDIAREEQANKLARQARTGVPNIEAVVTEATGGPRLNFLSRVATIANTIMSKLEGKINQELAIKIATDLMDPQATANALERALRREMNQARVVGAARAPFEATAEALRNPALRAIPQLTNAMAPDENAYNYNAMAR